MTTELKAAAEELGAVQDDGDALMTESELEREAMRIAQFPEQLEKIVQLVKKYRGES